MGSTVALHYPGPQRQGAAGLGGGEHFWVASCTLPRSLRAGKALSHNDDLDSATLLAWPPSLTHSFTLSFILSGTTSQMNSALVRPYGSGKFPIYSGQLTNSSCWYYWEEMRVFSRVPQAEP